MKKNLKKTIITIGLLGISILSVNAMQAKNNKENSKNIDMNRNVNEEQKSRHHKQIFDLREDVELPGENDNIIRGANGSYITTLDFIRECIKEKNLIYDKTKGEFFKKSDPNSLLSVSHARMIKNIINRFTEYNVKDYQKILDENRYLKYNINILRGKEKTLNSEHIYYQYELEGEEYPEDIDDENVHELNDKTSKLYNPELYKKLMDEKEKDIAENIKFREYNKSIEKEIEKLEKILKDEKHNRCTLLKKVKEGILKNLISNDYIFYEYEEFFKHELLLRNVYVSDDMKILEKIIKGVEKNDENYNDENYTLEKLKKRGVDAVYKVFLIVRKYLEIFSHDPKIFLEDDVRMGNCQYETVDIINKEGMPTGLAIERALDNLYYTHPFTEILDCLDVNNNNNGPILELLRPNLELLQRRNTELLLACEKYTDVEELERVRNEYKHRFDPLYRRELTKKKKKGLNKKNEIANELLNNEDFLNDLINTVKEEENIKKKQETKVKDLKNKKYIRITNNYQI